MKVLERLSARPSRPAGQAGPTTTRRALARFALASLVVASAVGIAGAVVSRRAAQTAATDDARTVTEVLAHSVIVPNLTDGLVDGDLAAVSTEGLRLGCSGPQARLNAGRRANNPPLTTANV